MQFYSITAQADKTLDSQMIADQIVHILEKRHQCAGEEYFQVQSFQDVMKSMNEMLGMVTAFYFLCRRHFAACRWYWRYEYHARLCHRENQGDWYP